MRLLFTIILVALILTALPAAGQDTTSYKAKLEIIGQKDGKIISDTLALKGFTTDFPPGMKKNDEKLGSDPQVGPATRKQNCAGFVADKLWNIGQYNIDLKELFDKVISVYGTTVSKDPVAVGPNRFGPNNVPRFNKGLQPGDLVIYGDASSGHIAIVKSNENGQVKILTKDNAQAVFEHVLSESGNDQLVNLYGAPTYWRLDLSKISSVKVVSNPISPVVKWSGNGHYYEAVLVPSGINWNNADAQAKAKGGHLVTITSADENAFVYSLVSADDRYWNAESWGTGLGPWIGIYREGGHGDKWLWVTGEPVTYQNWAPSEPNSWQESVAALTGHTLQGMFLKGPTWDDIDATHVLKSYVIEWDSNEPPTIALPVGYKG